MGKIKAWGVALRPAFFIFLPVRIASELVAWLTHIGIPDTTAEIVGATYTKPKYAPWFESFIGVWERSDSVWYLHIARDGYSVPSSDLVFFPLFPWLIRTLHAVVGGPWIVSGLLISNLCFFFSIVGILKLAELEWDKDTSVRAAWYYALFPGMFFCLSAYTEALFLMLSIFAFWFARQSQWLRAGLAAFLLGLTRSVGAAIWLPLIMIFFSQYKAKRVRFTQIPSLLIPPLALAVVCGVSFYYSDNPFGWAQFQESWGRTKEWPWNTLILGIEQVWLYGTSFLGGVYVFDLIGFGGLLGLTLWNASRKPSFTLPRLPWAYLVYSVLLVVPSLCAPYPGRALMCGIRFCALGFPMFFILAHVGRNQTWDQTIRVTFTMLYGLALAMFVSNQYMF